MPDPSPVSSSGAPTRGRRRMEPARRRLLLASGMALFGAFLPWVLTGLGNFSGIRGAGLWVSYAGLLGLAGALVPMRRLSAVQAAILAVVGVVLPLWQVVHMINLVGVSGWLPGPGLVLCLGGGVLAGAASWDLFRPAAAV